MWCGATCVWVCDDVEWAEEEDGEGDGYMACVHVHRVVGCEGPWRRCVCDMCVWCVGRRWCWVGMQESLGMLTCDDVCVIGVSCWICVYGCAVCSTMPLEQQGRRLWRRIWRV